MVNDPKTGLPAPDETAYISGKDFIAAITGEQSKYVLEGEYYRNTELKADNIIPKCLVDFAKIMIKTYEGKYGKKEAEPGDVSYYADRAVYEFSKLNKHLKEYPQSNVIIIAPGMKGTGELLANSYPQARVLNIDLPEMIDFRNVAVVENKIVANKNGNMLNVRSNMNKHSLAHDCKRASMKVSRDSDEQFIVSAIGVLPYVEHEKVKEFFEGFKNFPPETKLIFNTVNKITSDYHKELYKFIPGIDFGKTLSDCGIVVNQEVDMGNRTLYSANYIGKEPYLKIKQENGIDKVVVKSNGTGTPGS